jgi:hypothetical protein
MERLANVKSAQPQNQGFRKPKTPLINNHGLVPFKLGGKVNKTGPIYAHKGEFVLPPGVKPTTHQIMCVRKKGGKV